MTMMRKMRNRLAWDICTRHPVLFSLHGSKLKNNTIVYPRPRALNPYANLVPYVLRPMMEKVTP